MPDNIISIENAGVYHGKTPILNNVNLHLQKGEFAYLIGKTGSGKSSLLKTLYGELPLKEGTGTVSGFDLKKLTWKEIPFLRRKMGIVFQDFKLLTDRNVYDNLDFVLRATGWVNGQKRKQRIDEVLDMVHLPAKGYKRPYELSGGEQQRVDIARALLNNPELILADEPTGNLDPETTILIMDLLNNISTETKASVLMATHDYSILQQYPKRIIKVENNTINEHQIVEQI
ncbi:MAG TPA: ATP-binding cassette domain-containing protein [Edaphocola sp.]|nr:ATP-binding cassette domain-containing protein [Edaphocola sp.]